MDVIKMLRSLHPWMDAEDECRHFEYFVAENTGWSEGLSWFRTTETNYSKYRDAKAAAKAAKKRSPGSKHRVRKVQTTETFFKC